MNPKIFCDLKITVIMITHSLGATTLLSLVTIKHIEWALITHEMDHDYVTKKAIGIIYFLEATTVANFVTIKQTGHEILSRQHLGFRPAVWHWPFHDHMTGIQ